MRLNKIVLFSFLVLNVAMARAPVDHHSYAKAVRIAAPAVVNIYTDRQTQQNLSQLRSTLGSGVVIDSKGYILTNHHVVRNAVHILVGLSDGRRAKAKFIGSDPETDLAVLKINLGHLKPIPLGNSDNIHVGDVVLAIGNPFGLGQTVTQGIISAMGRNTVGINRLESYIQTDAAINPGNSGGALINTLGQLVGINTGIYTRSGGYQGVGFAIPVNVALNVLHQIIKSGYVKRGWLGLKVQTLGPKLAETLGTQQASGVVVMQVLPNTPASEFGFKKNDVITHLNNIRVSSSRGFLNHIAQRKPNTPIAITLLRNHVKKVIHAKVGTRPPPKAIDDRGHYSGGFKERNLGS